MSEPTVSEPVFISPKSRDVAQRLLAAAEVAEVDVALVRATRGGFLVPQEVADLFNEETEEPKAKAPAKAKASTKAKASKAVEPKEEGAE